MKPIQTVCITTRRPRSAADPGECETVYYILAGDVVKVTDQDGALLRFEDGEPCKQVLEPGDNPKQVAALLGRRYHTQMYGDSERGFWRDISRINGRGVP
jgi:hypothetical protein